MTLKYQSGPESGANGEQSGCVCGRQGAGRPWVQEEDQVWRHDTHWRSRSSGLCGYQGAIRPESVTQETEPRAPSWQAFPSSVDVGPSTQKTRRGLGAAGLAGAVCTASQAQAPTVGAQCGFPARSLAEVDCEAHLSLETAFTSFWW